MANAWKPSFIRAMRQVPIFSALDDVALAEILRRCPVMHYTPGERIFGPDERADRFFVVLSGKVRIFKLSRDGNEQVLHLYGAGQTFGEAAMWSGGTYPAHGRAVDHVQLLVVARAALEDLMAQHPTIGAEMLAGMSAKLREFARLIEELSLKDVPARLARVLLEQQRDAGRDTFRLVQAKRQIASQIGTTPETLSRCLARFKSGGLIGVRGSQITVLDAEALDELAR